MKKLKIILIIAVMGLIAFFIMKSLGKTHTMPMVSAPSSDYSEEIEEKITAIANLPNNKFSKESYNNVEYLIDFKYDKRKLGRDEMENEQMKEILLKNLYSVYAAKFIKQAFFVFENREWKLDDLTFITSECATLKKSPLLEKGLPVYDSLTQIQEVIKKYKEIGSFISSCKGLYFSEDDLSDKFPVSIVEEKIDIMTTYKNNNLENLYVNKCVRLHHELDKVPQYLFNAHYKFLENKFNNSTSLYSNFGSQRDYVNNFYLLLRAELDDLDNGIYKQPDFNERHDELLKILDNDSREAYNYFNNK